ncbi:MAG: ABC transporter permease, partial [Mesorhizobium sp.]
MGFIQDVLTSFVAIMPVTLAQSLILAFVVLGIMIPFRMLNFPDLTSEGAFPLGGCICGVLL